MNWPPGPPRSATSTPRSRAEGGAKIAVFTPPVPPNEFKVNYSAMEVIGALWGPHQLVTLEPHLVQSPDGVGLWEYQAVDSVYRVLLFKDEDSGGVFGLSVWKEY